MTFTLHPQLTADSILLADFEVSKLLMINDGAYPWFVLVPRIADIKDAYELSEVDHMQLTRESRALCEALMCAFLGEKMNVAALGNMVPQLHIHHIVRFASDPAWPGPIWGVQALRPLSEGEISDRIEKVKAGFLRVDITPDWRA